MTDQNSTRKKPEKLLRILKATMHGWIHRKDAIALSDLCLPSTISALSNRHGFQFERQWVQVPNRFGDTTPMVAYRLPKSEHKKAEKFIASYDEPQA